MTLPGAGPGHVAFPGEHLHPVDVDLLDPRRKERGLLERRRIPQVRGVEHHQIRGAAGSDVAPVGPPEPLRRRAGHLPDGLLQ